MVFSATTPLQPTPSKAVSRLMLPERQAIATPNVRSADRQLLSHARDGYMDTTHFDTVRFPPPEWASDIFEYAARDGSLAYTGYRGNENVLQRVAANVARFLGVPVDPARNLILTPGTQGALFAVLAAQIDPGDRVATMDPDYLFAARILAFLGADIGYVPMIEAGEEFTIDLEALEQEFSHHRTKHFVFSHPNNPTGAVFSKPVIQGIAALAQRYGVSVTVDELYSRLVYGERTFHHLAAEDGMFARTATLLGPSKTESLSGYRLGIVVGSDDLLQSVENVLSISALRAPAYAQHLLPFWLGPDEDWLRARIEEFEKLRGLTLSKLNELPWLDVKPQGGTAYLWPDVSPLRLSDLDLAIAFLENANVLVSPGYQFGPTASGRFRLCYARDERSWSEALDKMLDIMDAAGRRFGLDGRRKGC